MALTKAEKMVINNSAQNDSIPRYLVVCSVGCLRSPTIQMVLYNESELIPNVRCAGLDDLALIPVTERLIEWADFVICVERLHAEMIEKEWGFGGMIYNLSIPDDFQCCDHKLIQIVKDRLENMSDWIY